MFIGGSTSVSAMEHGFAIISAVLTDIGSESKKIRKGYVWRRQMARQRTKKENALAGVA